MSADRPTKVTVSFDDIEALAKARNKWLRFRGALDHDRQYQTDRRLDNAILTLLDHVAESVEDDA